jgi:hypothetical protein
MEDDDRYGGIDVDEFIRTINRQYEENEKSLREHFQSIQNQQKEIERQKQKLYSFVCDWQ